MKLNDDYKNGYTKALLDVYQLLSQYEYSLADAKVVSSRANRQLRLIIDAMIVARNQCMNRGIRQMVLVLLKNGQFRLRPVNKGE